MHKFDYMYKLVNQNLAEVKLIMVTGHTMWLWFDLDAFEEER